MKMALLVLGAFLAVLAFAIPAQAAEYAQTVRLGNCVIKPGSTLSKLVECAGEPVTKSTDGIDPKTGKIEEVWLYRNGNRTVLVHATSQAVRKVEVRAE